MGTKVSVQWKIRGKFRKDWVLNLKHIFLAERTSPRGAIPSPLYPSVACGLYRVMCWGIWTVHLGEIPGSDRTPVTWQVLCEWWSWRRMNKILFGKDFCESQLERGKDATVLVLEAGEEDHCGCSFCDKRSIFKDSCFAWKKGLSREKLCSSLKTGSSFAEKLLSVGRRKPASSVFSLLWPEETSTLQTPRKALSRASVATGKRRPKAELLTYLHAQMLPQILCFSSWMGFQWNLKEKLHPWVTALLEQQCHTEMSNSIISMFSNRC